MLKSQTFLTLRARQWATGLSEKISIHAEVEIHGAEEEPFQAETDVHGEEVEQQYNGGEEKPVHAEN